MLAASQRPLATAPWVAITGDRGVEERAVVGPDRDRRQGDPAGRTAGHGHRAGSHTYKIDAPHLSMVADPGAVTCLIITAADHT